MTFIEYSYRVFNIGIECTGMNIHLCVQYVFIYCELEELAFMLDCARASENILELTLRPTL
jgi:hypothetical protein